MIKAMAGHPACYNHSRDAQAGETDGVYRSSFGDHVGVKAPPQLARALGAKRMNRIASVTVKLATGLFDGIALVVTFCQVPQSSALGTVIE